MTVIASASRAFLFLGLAVMSVPLVRYGTDQAQLLGLAGVVTGFGLLVLHGLGYALGAGASLDAKPRRARHRPRVAPSRRPARWNPEAITWDQVAQTKADRYRGQTDRIRQAMRSGG